MSIADIDGGGNGGADFAWFRLPCAETECRHNDAVIQSDRRNRGRTHDGVTPSNNLLYDEFHELVVAKYLLLTVFLSLTAFCLSDFANATALVKNIADGKPRKI